MESRQHTPGPRRWRRWIGRSVLVLAGLLSLVAIAVAVLLGNLDRPSVKARIQRLARDSAGIELDYRALKIRLFSGVWLDGLVVATPAPLRDLAPELVRLDHLEALWSLSSLLGRGPKIRTVAVDGVALTIAQDAAGRTSLDLLGPPNPKPQKPSKPTPLSHLASEIFSGAAPVGRVEVTRVQAAIVRPGAAGSIERDAIGGLALQVVTRPSGKGWSAAISAGSPAAPLALALTRQGPRPGLAHLVLALGVSGDPDGFGLAVDLRVADQNLTPIRVAELLHLDASVKPDPARRRTSVEIARLAGADGAVAVSARAELADENQALVREADARIDLARLLAVAPKGTVPVGLRAGVVQAHVAGLQAGSGAPRLAPDGAVRLGADLSGGRLALQPGAAAVTDARAEVDARPSPEGGWNGQVSLRVAGADVTGPTRLSVRGLRLQTRLRDLKIDPASPAASSGTIRLTGEVANVGVRTPALRAAIEGVGLRVGATLSGRPPYAATVELPIDMVRLFDGRGRRLLAAPVKAELSAARVVPDAANPIASRADLQAQVDLGPVHASVGARKRRDDVDVDVAVKADNLGVARPFLSPALAAKLDWDRLAVDLQTKAQVQRLAAAAPFLREETTLRVDGLRAGRTGVRRLSLQASSSGDVRRHQATLSLSGEGIAINGHGAPDTRLHLTAAIDRARPSAKLHLDGDGAGRLALDANLGFAAGPRRLDVDLDLHADHLVLAGALRPFVPALEGVDLAHAALVVTARAALTGVVERIDREGGVHPSRDPARTAGGSLALTVHLADVAAAQADLRVGLGALDWKVGVRGPAARRELSSELRLQRLRLVSGEQRFELAQLQDTAAATIEGDPATGPAELTNQLVLAGLQQKIAPFVPTDAITLALAARRQRDGLLRISELRLADAGAGTVLSLDGAADLGMDRRLSVRGRLDQDLAKLRRLPGGMTASGHLGMAFEVDSPDLESFRTRAGVELDDVNLRAPAAGVAIDTMDAKIPVEMRVVVRPQGLTIPRDVHINPYASLRFADQEPLQAHSSFLSIVRLTTPFATIAPLAGNLSIEQNVLSLGQLEMGVRGGRVTGQCLLDWEGDDAKIEAHIRASGVKSSHGEPFDGDAALVVSTGERSIEGRAQILRIGRRHLLDLLDLQDPHHLDAAMNRIRFALKLGYPDQVRIAFNHGFASARVSLGGLARLIRIDEIRGIPTGSLLDKVLASPSKSEPE